MEDKIEIGEYVRTKEGYIGILIDIDEKSLNYLTIDCKRRVRRDNLYHDSYLFLTNQDIVKHSKNIKDLVQAGDIIHYRLKELNCYYYGIVHSIKDLRTLEDKLRVSNYSLEQVEILEILTKEQFEENSFKVK